LSNVKKGSREHSFVCKRFFNDVGDTIHLVYLSVFFLKSN
jgi:hypothetical protein